MVTLCKRFGFCVFAILFEHIWLYCQQEIKWKKPFHRVSDFSTKKNSYKLFKNQRNQKNFSSLISSISDDYLCWQNDTSFAQFNFQSSKISSAHWWAFHHRNLGKILQKVPFPEIKSAFKKSIGNLFYIKITFVRTPDCPI